MTVVHFHIVIIVITSNHIISVNSSNHKIRKCNYVILFGWKKHERLIKLVGNGASPKCLTMSCYNQQSPYITDAEPRVLFVDF